MKKKYGNGVPTEKRNVMSVVRPQIPQIVECGGALIEEIAFNRRVVGSTPTLVAT